MSRKMHPGVAAAWLDGQGKQAMKYTSVRGRTALSLGSSGRKTTARTQGGATKGSGKRHDY